jgi:TatA/E family protein of Tat protein translocase
MIGLPEVLIILFIILIILGPKKLPELARALGKAVREYKKAAEEEPKRERRTSKKSKKKLAG